MSTDTKEQPLQNRHGDMDEVSWLNAELLEEVLRKGAKIKRLIIEPAVGKGDNFLSVLYRTRVEYFTEQSEEVLVANLIVKGQSPSEFVQTYSKEITAFEREIMVYTEVLPRFYSFAEAKLGKNTFQKFSATYYKSSRHDTLILDDLRAQGFIMAPRKDRLDLDHCKMILRKLAQFHALSVAYNEKHPGYILQFDDKVFSENNRHRITQIFPTQIDSIVKVLRKWGIFDDVVDKLDALKDNYANKVIDTCKLVDGGPKVLLHGDCWVNNILFKYSETGQLKDLRFVDFQVTRVGSPAIDLNSFLFSSPQINVTLCHFDDLLVEYCKEFERCARALGYAGSCVTFEKIREEVNRTLFFGFNSLITTMAVVLADPDDSPSLETVTEEMLEEGKDINLFEKAYSGDRFREAFRHLLPIFNERGVLD